MGKHYAAILFSAAAAGLVLAGVFWRPADTSALTGQWLTFGALIGALALAAGKWVTDCWKGLFVDGRNKISLSRIQMAVWTVLIAATVYAAYSWNLKFNFANLGIPPEFFWLLGIGAVSLVGSPLAKNAKFSLKIDDKEKSDAEIKPDADGRGGVAITGVIHSNRNVKDAKFIDIFKGEEIGNAANVDIGKVQMAVFTVIAAVIFGLMIANAFAESAGEIKELPTLSQSFIYILLISHAGYLAHKAVPHSKTK